MPFTIVNRTFVAIFFVAITHALGSASALAQVPARAVSDHASTVTSTSSNPLQSSFKTQKVIATSAGTETLEDTDSASVGDVLQYTAVHVNVSKRRLLKVDFSIPVPEGTRYVDASARPAQGAYLRESGGKRLVRWRVDALQPGEAVTLSLRVQVEPDPSLRPAPVGNARPEFRR